jgi:ankyrin repeat protein
MHLSLRGASVNAADHEDGMTALHMACSDDRDGFDPALARFLLDSGAEVDAATNDGRTPLRLLCDALADLDEKEDDAFASKKCRIFRGVASPVLCNNP